LTACIPISAAASRASSRSSFVAFELARAAREKFGGDSLADFVAAYNVYRERIDWVPR